MQIAVFAGSAHPALAESVARRLGIGLGHCIRRRFADGEIGIQIEESVRGRDAYVIQSTCPPVNDHLVELLVMLDALRRASAGRITAVVPYFGYARQERKATGREPITARLIANLLARAGADRVVTIDLHAPAIEGFFDVWSDQLTALSTICEHLASLMRPESVIVAPDLGAVRLAERYARLLRRPVAITLKRHSGLAGNHRVEVAGLIGDVRGRIPLIVDDMISTGSTIHECVTALLRAKARPKITIAATHGILVGPALDYLREEAVSQVIVTDTVPVPPEKRLDKMSVLSVGELLANVIRRLSNEESIHEFTPFALEGTGR